MIAARWPRTRGVGPEVSTFPHGRTSTRRRSPHSLALLTVAIVALAGCEHTQPLDPTTVVGPLGPHDTVPPARLTFNTGVDTTPAFGDSFIVYSRQTPDRTEGDRCLAFLPPLGGTLLREACPPEGRPDTTREGWMWPAVSPDGRSLAFVRRIVVGFDVYRQLVVAPIDSVAAFRVLVNGVYRVSRDTVGNAYLKLSWRGSDSVRFVGEYISSVDTIVPVGVFAVALSGGDPVRDTSVGLTTHYANRADGGFWYVPYFDSTAVYTRPAAGGAPTLLARTTNPVYDLARARDALVLIDAASPLPTSPPGTPTAFRLLRYDPTAGGTFHQLVAWPSLPAELTGAGSGPGLLLVASVNGAVSLWRLDVQ